METSIPVSLLPGRRCSMASALSFCCMPSSNDGQNALKLWAEMNSSSLKLLVLGILSEHQEK